MSTMKQQESKITPRAAVLNLLLCYYEIAFDLTLLFKEKIEIVINRLASTILDLTDDTLKT